VIKKSALALSLITLMVGVWVLTRGQAQEAACSSYNREFGHGAVATLCARAVASYLMGTALTMGGAVIAVLLVFSIAKQMREKNWRLRLPSLARRDDSSVSSVVR
jgi:multisubunit Na+/H+ antiporter MnhC subunit